ncbi:ankyrin, partial [Lojkania enalia]
KGSLKTALHIAANAGKTSILQFILSQWQFDIRSKSDMVNASLHLAVEKGYPGTVQMLLDGGADVNAQGGRYGNALQAASSEGHEQIVRLLVDKGA